jgi:hypothetical protein
MRRRTWLLAVAFAFSAIWVGMVGASAFHPNEPSLAPSELLWQIFGLFAYAGIIAMPLLAAIGLASLVIHLCGRWHARHQGV